MKYCSGTASPCLGDGRDGTASMRSALTHPSVPVSVVPLGSRMATRTHHSLPWNVERGLVGSRLLDEQQSPFGDGGEDVGTRFDFRFFGGDDQFVPDLDVRRGESARARGGQATDSMARAAMTAMNLRAIMIVFSGSKEVDRGRAPGTRARGAPNLFGGVIIVHRALILGGGGGPRRVPVGAGRRVRRSAPAAVSSHQQAEGHQAQADQQTLLHFITSTIGWKNGNRRLRRGKSPDVYQERILVVSLTSVLPFPKACGCPLRIKGSVGVGGPDVPC